MKRLLHGLLAALTWTTGCDPYAQSALQAQLEANLGPIIIDNYEGMPNSYNGVTSGPNVPACSYTNPASSYRGCMQAVLSGYAQQGVVGVRFQFAMNGQWSTPFVNEAGALSPSWQNSFSLFLQDLRAANMRYVSISPDWFTYGIGNMTIYGCVGGSRGAYTYNFTPTCTSANANAVFYPWLPWAYTYCPGTPDPPTQNSCGNTSPNPIQGDIFDATQVNDYYDVPQLGDPSFLPGSTPPPPPWAWSNSDPTSPLFNFFNFIFQAVNNAQLQVREVDFYPEIQIWDSSVKGRLVYDNVQFVHPLDIVNQIMANNNLSPTATFSTQAFQPSYTSNTTPCNSSSGDSFLVIPAYLLLSAETGGPFGAYQNICSLPLINPTDTIPGQPASQYPFTVTDIHTYPADTLDDPAWGFISNPNYSGCQHYPDGNQVSNPTQCTQYVNGQCVQWAQNCQNDTDGNASSSSVKAATYLFNAISSFAQHWERSGQIPQNAPIVIGETDEYNPGGVGRDGITFPDMAEGTDCTTYYPYGDNLFDTHMDATGISYAVNLWCIPDWNWHRPWSSAAAFENVSGFTAAPPLGTPSLNQPGNVIRPWEAVSWGTVLSPGPLSGDSTKPYNVGACTFSQLPSTYTLSSSAGTLNIPVTNSQNSQNCWWSTGPTPPLTSGSSNNFSWIWPSTPTWQRASGAATFSYQQNTSNSQRSFLVTIAGQGVTITQAGPLAGPTLLSPANSATNVPSVPELSWSQSTNASQYQVYLGTQSPPPQVATLSGANSTTYSPSAPLVSGTTYYWYVAAVDSLGNKATSPQFSFSTTSDPSGYFYDFNGNLLPSGSVTLVVDSTPYPSLPNPYVINLPVGYHTIATSLPAGYALAGYLLGGYGRIDSYSVYLYVPPAGVSLNWYYLPTSVTLSSGTLSSPKTYNASSSITAGTGVTIQNSAGIVFQSGGTITLTPGFQAGGVGSGSGTAFTAYIGTNW